MSVVVPILKLCRIEYVGFGYLALLGAFAEIGLEISPSRAFALLLANMAFVAWTFAHNDLCDVEVDRRIAALDERVLVRGDLSMRAAKVLIASLIAVMIALSWRFAGGKSAVAFAAASAFAIAYDLVSKRLLGSDFLFAASAACLVLAGVFSANDGFTMSGIGLVVVGVFFLEHLFFNAIGGGLKDVVSDHQVGAVTLAQRFVRVEGEAISIAPTFRIVGLSLKCGSFLLAAVPVWSHASEAKLQSGLLAFVGAVAVFFSIRLLWRRRYDWLAIAKDLMPIEMASRLFVPLLLLDRIGGFLVALFFFVPAFGYLGFSRVVHSRGFALPKRF